MDNCDFSFWALLLGILIGNAIYAYAKGLVIAAWEDHKRSKKSKLCCEHKNITEFDNEKFCEDCGEQVFFLNAPSPPESTRTGRFK